MTKQTGKNLPAKKPALELKSYTEIKKDDLIAIVEKYKNLVINKETGKEAEKGLSVVKQKCYEINRIVDGNKKIVNTYKKEMEAEGKGLIDVIMPTREYLQAGIDRLKEAKAEAKRKKEAEQQRLMTERRGKIYKVQTEFSSALIQASTVERVDELEKSLLAFEPTEEEFGDLKLSFETTIAGIQLDINAARTRIKNEINAKKLKELNEAKEVYFHEDGKAWDGEDDVEAIKTAIATVINAKEKAKVIKEYIDLGGEMELVDNLSLDALIGHLSTRKAELVEIAKENKKAKEAIEKLINDRSDSLIKAGITDADQIYKMLENDHPNKAIQDLTEVEFNTFKGNLVAIKTEVDRKKVPVDNPAAPKPDIKFEGSVTIKQEVKLINGEWIDTKKHEEHKARHIELHSALDELFADYIANHPNQTKFTEMPIMQLLDWSNIQQQNPDHKS